MTIRLISTPGRTSVKDVPPKTLASGELTKGDTISGTSILRNAAAQFDKAKGAVVGGDTYSITVTTPPQALLKTQARLPGGTVRAEGRSSVLKSTITVPVVGGTGVFAGARGTAESSGLSGNRTLNVYRLRLPSAPPPPPPPAPACANGHDDDGDGRVDYPADPGCSGSADTDESDPPPPPPTVQIINFWACPGSDTHATVVDAATGQLGRACNRDWSASAFAPGKELVCSAEALGGSGQAIVMALLRDGAQLLATPDGYRLNDPHWYSWLHYIWDPAIPSGSYACQVKLDGSVAAQRSFVIGQ